MLSHGIQDRNFRLVNEFISQHLKFLPSGTIGRAPTLPAASYGLFVLRAELTLRYAGPLPPQVHAGQLVEVLPRRFPAFLGVVPPERFPRPPAGAAGEVADLAPIELGRDGEVAPGVLAHDSQVAVVQAELLQEPVDGVGVISIVMTSERCILYQRFDGPTCVDLRRDAAKQIVHLRHVVDLLPPCDQERRVPDLVAGHGLSLTAGPGHGPLLLIRVLPLPGKPRCLQLPGSRPSLPRSPAGLGRSCSSCAARDNSLRRTFQSSAYNASCAGVMSVITAASHVTQTATLSCCRLTASGSRSQAVHYAAQVEIAHAEGGYPARCMSLADLRFQRRLNVISRHHAFIDRDFELADQSRGAIGYP